MSYPRTGVRSYINGEPCKCGGINNAGHRGAASALRCAARRAAVANMEGRDVISIETATVSAATGAIRNGGPFPAKFSRDLMQGWSLEPTR